MHAIKHIPPTAMTPTQRRQEIAAREGVDGSYLGWMLNLTTLAPDIVATILDDTLPSHVTLLDLATNPPVLWEEQQARLSETAPDAADCSAAAPLARVSSQHDCGRLRRYPLQARWAGHPSRRPLKPAATTTGAE